MAPFQGEKSSFESLLPEAGLGKHIQKNTTSVLSNVSEHYDLGTLRRPYRGLPALHKKAIMKSIIQSSRRHTYHVSISVKALCSESDATTFYTYDFNVNNIISSYLTY